LWSGWRASGYPSAPLMRGMRYFWAVVASVLAILAAGVIVAGT
jgi:hypothetical protein